MTGLPRRGLLAAALLPRPALAQAWPDRPVRIVVPNPAGGASDILSRLLARELQPRLGQPFPVENRSGSNGIIGLDAVAKARPPGSALIVATVTQYLCNPFVYRSIPYDLDADFVPVGLSWEYYNIAVVPAALVPARRLPDFVAWARARPAGLAYGSNGIATSPHLLGALFMDRHRLDGVHVPFRGAAETAAALLRGDVQFTITDIASLLPYIQKGDLAPLAVTGPERWPGLPGVPTMAEVGMPELQATIWTGFCGTAGMAPDAVARLVAAMDEALADPALQDRIRTAGALPLRPDPAALSRRFVEERPRWGEMVRLAGARLD
ncbi:Bug family tripartite tricarboxylate transporter substrate binding protein [Paracraurococcus lichenis]|uniref:Tripartite tricarboxylate transporter substrate binding protein n=1 Tax=Paracraurococcus lichenis TaxID=3064888 RepID=A0ABT9E902_9PROT|nr:tripartite tricarboxylate transporter substrate binding protein [Paracraurococcus sp. LOR1-02]MDO9712674.1 tripartite tricarboxylate transporter substrate binding protein [Paracraurococcus sp. LOR1-02]